ncbi:MAG TPA: sigma-70 region 4 domain-containing protein [Armatimonadota bacterium]|nr:sigma-70 region 4 domain-containing protein [Armatimonadota bacterium]
MLAPELAEQLGARARLSAKQTRVMTLVLTEQLTFDEIAVRLEMAPSTVKTHYYRGVLKLEQGQQRFETAEDWYHWLLHEAMGTGQPSHPATPLDNNVHQVGTRDGEPVLAGDRVRYQGMPVLTAEDLAHPGRWRQVAAAEETIKERQRVRRLKAPRDKATGGLEPGS